MIFLKLSIWLDIFHLYGIMYQCNKKCIEKVISSRFSFIKELIFHNDTIVNIYCKIKIMFEILETV